MEDLKKLDDEIVRCAEAVHDTLASLKGARYFHEDHAVHALFCAVAAKRSASRPKPLSADEAHDIYMGDSRQGRTNRERMQAVLDACLSRAIKVIERLQKREDGDCRDCRSMADIRSALSREG